MNKEELKTEIRKVFKSSPCPEIYYSSATDRLVELAFIFSNSQNIRLIEENQNLKKQLNKQ